MGNPEDFVTARFDEVKASLPFLKAVRFGTIWRCSNSLGGYDLDARRIWLNSFMLKRFDEVFWLIVLLHEVRHAEQVLCGLIPEWKFRRYYWKKGAVYWRAEVDAIEWSLVEFRRRWGREYSDRLMLKSYHHWAGVLWDIKIKKAVPQGRPS